MEVALRKKKDIKQSHIGTTFTSQQEGPRLHGARLLVMDSFCGLQGSAQNFQTGSAAR